VTVELDRTQLEALLQRLSAAHEALTQASQ